MIFLSRPRVATATWIQLRHTGNNVINGGIKRNEKYIVYI